MPKYLVAASYVGDGVKGLVKDGGTARRAAATRAIESVGGHLESFFFAFGDVDAYIVADLPDNTAASALAIAINASGAVRIRTTVLLTVEEVDAAVKKATSYRPPGA